MHKTDFYSVKTSKCSRGAVCERVGFVKLSDGLQRAYITRSSEFGSVLALL